MNPYFRQDTMGGGAVSDRELRMLNGYAGTYSPSDYEMRLMEESRLRRSQPYIASPFGGYPAMNSYSQPMPMVSEQGFIPAFAQGVRDTYNTLGNFANQLPIEMNRVYGSAQNMDKALEDTRNLGLSEQDGLLAKAIKYLREIDMRRTEEIERDNALSRLQELLDQSRNYREVADSNRAAQRMKPLSSYDKKESTPKK